jgi:hypothetical protein
MLFHLAFGWHGLRDAYAFGWHGLRVCILRCIRMHWYHDRSGTRLNLYISSVLPDDPSDAIFNVNFNFNVNV